MESHDDASPKLPIDLPETLTDAASLFGAELQERLNELAQAGVRQDWAGLRATGRHLLREVLGREDSSLSFAARALQEEMTNSDNHAAILSGVQRLIRGTPEAAGEESQP